MKFTVFIFIALLQLSIKAQSDSIPDNILALGIVEVLSDPIIKGENINFEFYTEFNREVSLQLYAEDGSLISTTHIDVFSEKGLALTTRSFEPATYYLCLKLKTKTLIKKVTIVD